VLGARIRIIIGEDEENIKFRSVAGWTEKKPAKGKKGRLNH
jgi:hypothetical protein